MAFTPQTWPGRVVPSDREQAELATRKLFLDLFPGHPVTSEAIAVLTRWFDAGWCVDAIKVALDNLPEGREGYQPRRGDQESPEDFLVRRLRAWFRDEDDDFERNARLAPPRAGQSLDMHLRLKRQQQINDGLVSRPRKLTAAGQEARKRARERANEGRPDPVARARARDARLQRALDALGSELPPAHVNAGQNAPDARRDSQLVAGYAARAATVRHDPTVRRVLARLTEERRRPTAEETAVLRRAIRGAHHRAGLGTLDAATADATNAVLNEDAQRILTYLDHAVNSGLTLDQTLALMHTQVEAVTEQGPGTS
ncbi:hypothetical protein EIL87_18395 [Saccharopolyspora rhizosphaerae]|uniref:Uncharacterized protein n=1 Tax=Saccharopolyspora rhizosphaerae TaxID=2492662 RepID=A0A426JNK1_9PSEU|nr:hypothetical protein [Saccharopolyspora rhizosphaerae]RRO14716.1 hypothetical protein EIL87_18395 [Saccharopolyspora rhizosphaerae]